MKGYSQWREIFHTSTSVSCKVDLGSLVPDKTFDLTLPLVDSGCGSVHLLLCLSGIAMNEVNESQNDVTEESYVSVMYVCMYVCMYVQDIKTFSLRKLVVYRI